MKWIIVFFVLMSCQQKPDTIEGQWYKSKWQNGGFVSVTFDSLLTVKYNRGITWTPYSVNANTLTVDKHVMFFPKGDYVMEFFNDQVTLTGPQIVILER